MIVAAVIVEPIGQRLAAGIPKAKVALSDRPIVEWAVRAFSVHPDVASVLVVASVDSVAASTIPSPAGPRMVAAMHPRQESVDPDSGAQRRLRAVLVQRCRPARGEPARDLGCGCRPARRSDAVNRCCRWWTRSNASTARRRSSARSIGRAADRATPQVFVADVLLRTRGPPKTAVSTTSATTAAWSKESPYGADGSGDERTFKITTPLRPGAGQPTGAQ